MTVTERTPRGGSPLRVDDVVAALVGARCRDGEVARLDDGRDPVADERMLDPDAPRPCRPGPAAHADVPARIDRKAREPSLLEERDGPVDRPALHERGRVESTGRTVVEVAPRLPAKLLTAFENAAHLRVRLLDGAFAPGQAADLALGLERAERRVDPTEPLEHFVDRVRGDRFVADVDDDRHPHHVLDATETRCDLRGSAHTLFALTSASCSDCANASLV